MITHRTWFRADGPLPSRCGPAVAAAVRSGHRPRRRWAAGAIREPSEAGSGAVRSEPQTAGALPPIGCGIRLRRSFLLGLELVVILGAVVLAISALARRIHVAPPIALLVVGAALGFLPVLREVELPPEVVLLLFLPVLLYWESLTTSLREIRSNLRAVVLTSTLLVVVTAGAVAVATHAIGLEWGAAWVLGAAVAPTDATATGALAGNLPRRTLTTLRAESLVNDGTALVILAIAVGAFARAEEVTPLHVSGLLLLSYGGGVAIGFAVAGVAALLRRRIADALQENVIILLTPFTAYLVAELIDASGVLAVVICGLTMSQLGPRIGGAAARSQTNAFWSLTTWLLNGALFVLVGIEMQTAIRGLDGDQILQGVVAVLVVTVVLIAVRFAFLFGSVGLIRLADRAKQLRIDSDRALVVRGTAGFRGAVSLAAALSVPVMTDARERFPDRDLVIFTAVGVIAVTLVLQGLLLPVVVRWAALPPDHDVEQELEHAEVTATKEALEALDELAGDTGAGAIAVRRSRRELEAQLRSFQQEETEPDEDQRAVEDYERLRLAVVGRKRAVLLRLRDEQRIDDIVLRRIQNRLDNEEIRLTNPDPATD